MYISVMKKSKEFWVDWGNLDDLKSGAQAKDVVQADALGGTLVLMGFLISAVIASTGIGGVIGALAIRAISISAADALYQIGLGAALSSIFS